MFYLQLRQSLTNGGHETFNAFNNAEDDTEDCAYDSGNPHFGEPDSDFPENIYMDEDVPLHNEKVRRDQQHEYVINHYIHNKIEEFC